MVRACLTAPPRACRVAAYRVFRVTPAANGSGPAEAGRERDKRNRGGLKNSTPSMDFAWSDQQRELLDAVGRFASQQLQLRRDRERSRRRFQP